ncbi:hypothetical protein DFH28DRAFT_933768 [Melampsora americana]|nr:hypothetical protein DFH28DRAFT_933768 [Melampsora americana]
MSQDEVGMSHSEVVCCTLAARVAWERALSKPDLALSLVKCVYSPGLRPTVAAPKATRHCAQCHRQSACLASFVRVARGAGFNSQVLQEILFCHTMMSGLTTQIMVYNQVCNG